jgi:uncharacterized membrane protein
MRIAAIAVALIAAAAPAAAQQMRLVCLGNEPFWNLEVGRATAKYSAPDATVVLVPSNARHAAGMPGDNFRVYELRRADGKGVVTLVVTRPKEACSDGMSDRTYAYHAVVILAEDVRAGCCYWAP